MKKLFLSVLFSILSLLVMSLILSIVVSLLQYNNSIKINGIVLQIITILIFLLSGMIRGIINKKQGLLGAIPFILVYVLCVLIFKSNNNIFFVILKCVSYLVGSILGVNLIRTKTK